MSAPAVHLYLSVGGSLSRSVSRDQLFGSRVGAEEISLPVVLVLIVLTPLLPFHQVTATDTATYQPHDGIYIVDNGGFNQTKGVVAGNGTASNPYIIEGWEITSSPGIYIRYTSVFFIIRNVYVHGAEIGVQFLYVTNGQLVNSTISESNGVSVESSNYNVIANNTISKNAVHGLFVFGSRYLNVTGNIIAENVNSGVDLRSHSNIRFTANKVLRNGSAGIDASSSNLVFSDNVISQNGGPGIWLEYNGNINVTGNGFFENSNGIVLTYLTGTVRIFHNHFVQNWIRPQARSSLTGVNIWDDGYPSGGNYWSDYAGSDICSGPDQNACDNADGIGDTAYGLDINNYDRYPLMQPWGRQDTDSPYWPGTTTLNAISVGPFGLTLEWTSASDDNWVAKYRVYQGMSMIADLPGTVHSHTVNELLPATTYVFKVEAGDAWNNWSIDGPSLTVTTPDIPPLPPPQPGAVLFYRLRFPRDVHQGELFSLKNEFWNIGEAHLRIVSVKVASDFGTYTLFSANPQYPTICGNTYSGTLDVGVGQGRTLNETITVPSDANIGNRTITATVGWQYLDLVQVYPWDPPVSLWCDAPPLVLQIWAQVHPNPQSNQNPSPNQNPPPRQPPSGPSIGPFSISRLSNWVTASIPFALGIYSALVVSAVFLLIREKRRARKTPLAT